MEENQQQSEENNSVSDSQLIVTENMRSYLFDMSKWANFLGYVGIIACVFLFILGTTMVTKSSETTNSFNEQMVGYGIIFYSIVFFYPGLLLISYAKKANEGVLYGNQQELENSVAKLKSFFKYFGTLAIIGIALNFISLLSIFIKK